MKFRGVWSQKNQKYLMNHHFLWDQEIKRDDFKKLT